MNRLSFHVEENTARHRSQKPGACLDDETCSASPDALPKLIFESKAATDFVKLRQKDVLVMSPALSANGDSTCVFEGGSSSLAAEQFRLMRRRLVNAHPQGGSVLLTSPCAGDGKSLNVHNLGWALAEAGQDTVLLDLDLRRPTQSNYFRYHPRHSIEDVLTNKISPDAALCRLSSSPLFFLGQDKPARNPSELLRSDTLRNLLQWAQRNFAWVLVDAPPLFPIADVEEMLPVLDLAILVVRERVTPRATVQRAVERLGKRLDYVIFNDVVLSSSYGYGYGYDLGKG